jgi:hypothetical protein
MTRTYEPPLLVVFHCPGGNLGMGIGACSTGSRYLNGCANGSVPGGGFSHCKTGCAANFTAGYDDCGTGSLPGESTVYTQCCSGSSADGTEGTCISGGNANAGCTTGTAPNCFGCS